MHFASVTTASCRVRPFRLEPPLPPPRVTERAARRYYRYIASEAARPTRKGVANRGAPCNRPACYRKHSGWGRARRRHVALSLRARQSSARARRALARRGAREGALKGALTWLTTSRPILSLSLSLSLCLSFSQCHRITDRVYRVTIAFVPFSAALCTRYDPPRLFFPSLLDPDFIQGSPD